MNPRSIVRSLLSVGLALSLVGCLGSAPSNGGGGHGGTGGGGGSGSGGGGGVAGGGGGGTGGGGSAGGGGGGGGISNPGMLLCTTSLTIQGQYTLGNPMPTGYEGSCWPDGDWNFNVTLGTPDCGTAPAPAPAPAMLPYDFHITEDMDYNHTTTFNNDPSNMYVSSNITTDGGGICGAVILIYSSDGKTVYNLHAVLNADNSITGQGDIKVFDTDQRM